MIRNIGLNQSNSLVTETTKNEQKVIIKKGDNQASRIDELKDQIKNGKYTIDLEATAMKMAQEIKP